MGKDKRRKRERMQEKGDIQRERGKENKGGMRK